MQRIFHTPEGVRDIYNDECSRKRHLQEKIHDVFTKYGFRDIETPTFEFFEVFSREVGTIPSKDLYKFFDREGNTLVLRPDMTPSVARACATYFSPEKEAVSLCYTGQTFINTSGYQGRLKETTQMGVERIGDESAMADAELLAMTVESLLASGLNDFQVSVGEVNYFKALVKEAGLEKEEILNIRQLISEKNYFGLEEQIISNKDLNANIAKAILELPQMFGTADVLKKARELTDNKEALKAVDRLEEIYKLLKVYGYEKYFTFDFGMVSKYQYYTGIIFQAYTYGTGEPLIKGGRYNELMRHFGKSAASIGFAIVVDNLLTALTRQKLIIETKNETILLTYTKGEQEEAIKKAQALRKEGKKVRLCLEKGEE